jgi:hypothetical protein
MTKGARHKLGIQYQGLCPVICSTQSQNLRGPKTQPMATDWKKQTQSRGIGEQQ